MSRNGDLTKIGHDGVETNPIHQGFASAVFHTRRYLVVADSDLAITCVFFQETVTGNLAFSMVKGLAFCLSHHLTDRGGLRRGGSRPLDSFPWHATAFGAPEKGDGDGREFYPRNPIFDSENAWYFWMLSNSENIYMKNYETVLHTCPLYFIILKGTSMNITPFPDGSQMETTVETSPRLSSGLTYRQPNRR
jgi:hypothetical protein